MERDGGYFEEVFFESVFVRLSLLIRKNGGIITSFTSCQQEHGSKIFKFVYL